MLLQFFGFFFSWLTLTLGLCVTTFLCTVSTVWSLVFNQPIWVKKNNKCTYVV